MSELVSAGCGYWLAEGAQKAQGNFVVWHSDADEASLCSKQRRDDSEVGLDDDCERAWPVLGGELFEESDDFNVGLID